MKGKLFLAVIVFSGIILGANLLVLLTQNTFAQEVVPQIKRYSIQSGIIEFIYQGPQEGREVVYFDQWGLRESKFTATATSKWGLQNVFSLFTQEWIYVIHVDKRVGNKKPNKIWQDLIAKSDETDLGNMEVVYLQSLGGVEKGKQKILGRTCDVWYVERIATTYWIYKGIVLQTKIQMGAKEQVITAVNFLEDAPVSEDKFFLPPGIQYIDGDLNLILLSLLRN